MRGARWVVLIALGWALLAPAAVAAAPTVMVSQEAVFLLAKGHTLRGVVTLNFPGTNPAGWRVSLPTGYRALGVQQVTGKIRRGPDWVLLPGSARKAFITFELPANSYQLGWNQRIYDPTQVMFLFTGPGVSLPIVLNQLFFQGKPPTRQISGITFQTYYTNPMAAGTVFRLNLQLPGQLAAPPPPPAAAAAGRVLLFLSFVLALGGLGGVWLLYRRGLPDPQRRVRREAAELLERLRTGEGTAAQERRLRILLRRLGAEGGL